MTENGISYCEMKRFSLMMYLPQTSQVSYHCNCKISEDKGDELKDSLAVAFFAGQMMLGEYKPVLLSYKGVSTDENIAPQSILVLEDTDSSTNEILSLLLSSPRIEPVDVCKEVVEIGRYAAQDYFNVQSAKGITKGQIIKFEEILETYSSLLEYRLNETGYTKQASILPGNFTPVFLVEKLSETNLKLYTFSENDQKVSPLLELRPPSMFIAGLGELNKRFQDEFFSLVRELYPYFPSGKSIRLDTIALKKRKGEGSFAYLAAYPRQKPILLGLSQAPKQEYENQPVGSLHTIQGTLLERAVEKEDPVSFLLEKIPNFKNVIEIKDISAEEGQEKLMGAWR